MPHSTCHHDGCDTTLFATRRPKKWCHEHNPSTPKFKRQVFTVCQYCDEPLPADRPGKMYCGVNCNSAAGYHRRKQLKGRPIHPVKYCSAPECERIAHSRNMCRMHYRRWARANGMANSPSDKWSDARRSNYHARRARMNGAKNADRVMLAELLERDHATCSSCEQHIDVDLAWPDPMSPSIDHTIPLSRGGEHSMDNTTAMHLTCNRSKGARVDLEDSLVA